MTNKRIYLMMSLVSCVGIYISVSLFLSYLPYGEHQLLKMIGTGGMTLVFLTVFVWLIIAYRKEKD